MAESTAGILEKPNPTHTLRAFYTGKYNSAEKSDSPETARINLVKMAFPYLLPLGESDSVLDIGSGKQVLERQLRNYFKNKAKRPLETQIVTLDCADINYGQLMENKQKNVNHVMAGGEMLPFADNSMALVVSSMALDLMPEEAIGEVFRILKPGSHALITLHHPALIPNNLDELLQKRNLGINERRVYEMWDYLVKNGTLSNDKNVIKNRFLQYGFSIKNISEAHDRKDTWWEVDLVKPE